MLLQVGDWQLTEKTSEHLIVEMAGLGYTLIDIVKKASKGSLTYKDSDKIIYNNAVHGHFDKVPAIVMENGLIIELITDHEGIVAVHIPANNKTL